MLDKRIKFDERWDRNDGTTVLWFIAPKELLPECPDAESVAISVECPTEYISADYATVEFSPTKYVKEDGCYVDYDWREVSVPYDEIVALIELAEESGWM